MTSRALARFGVVAVLAATLSCADKPPVAPGGGSNVLMLRIDAGSASQLSPNAKYIVAYAAYNVHATPFDTIVNLAHSPQVALTGTAPVNVSFPVDISPCLADPHRTGSQTGCSLYVAAALFDPASEKGGDAFIDGPYEVSPGHAPSLKPIDLFSSVKLSPDSVTLAVGDSVLLTLTATSPAGATMSLSGGFLGTRPVPWYMDSATIAISPSGVLTALGAGTSAVFANGFINAGVMAVHVTPRPTAAITASDYVTCGLTVDGAAYCWGNDTNGLLGDGGSASSPVPVPVSGGLTFNQISASAVNVCAVSSHRDAWCWGSGFSGSLGNGTGGSGAVSREPARVSGGLKFSSVSVGSGYVCGLTTSGSAYCWGSNANGTLGTGDTVSSTVPRAVTGGLTFKFLHAGLNSTCGLTGAGVAWCWGTNTSGQLGTGTLGGFSSVPVQVAGGRTFSTIGTGITGCGLATTGVTYCWGTDRFGTLGTGTPGTSQNPTPTPIVGGLAFKVIWTPNANLTFYKDACGLLADGTAYCWGSNAGGGLGVTTTTATCQFSGNTPPSGGCSGTPVAVATSAKFSALAPGAGQTCGITTTHTLLCWGYNSLGQVGDGTTTDRFTPVAVAGNLKMP